jgi:5-methylcytosine-specific restriction endonuclease McrA
MKTCSKCKAEKDDNQYNTSKHKDGLSSWCKQCTGNCAKEIRIKNKEFRYLQTAKYADKNNDRAKKWYVENRQRVIDRVKEWRLCNKGKRQIESANRRAEKSNGTLTNKEWSEIKNSFGNKCLCCGSNEKRLTVDHVIPLSKGGLHVKENIQPLCINCNSKKHTKETDYRYG